RLLPAPVVRLATPTVPPRPSSQSPPGTQKIRPTVRPHSTRASLQSLLRRTTPAPPAHHLATPVASSAVPSRHLARSSLSWLACSSGFPFSPTLPSSSASGNPFLMSLFLYHNSRLVKQVIDIIE